MINEFHIEEQIKQARRLEEKFVAVVSRWDKVFYIVTTPDKIITDHFCKLYHVHAVINDYGKRVILEPFLSDEYNSTFRPSAHSPAHSVLGHPQLR